MNSNPQQEPLRLSHADGLAEMLTKRVHAEYAEPLLAVLKNPTFSAFLGAYVDHQIKAAIKNVQAMRKFQCQ